MTVKRRSRMAIVVMLALVGVIWGVVAWQGLEPKLGLDLKGGIAVVLTPKERADASALEKAVDIIRNRVDALGVAEPEISRQGENILIQLPGIEDQKRALTLIGTTAKLRFRPVLEMIDPNNPAYAKEGPKDCSDQATFPGDDPKKEVVFCARDRAEEAKGLTATSIKYRLGPAALEGSDVSGAQAQLPPASTLGTGGWEVSLDLTKDGGRKFEETTGRLACLRGQGDKDQLAIVLDKVIESHPRMDESVECNRGISGGTAQITGNFAERDAKDLALVLRYGALPIELEPLSTTTVSPTLGRDSLRSGLFAGMFGLGVVLVYVLLFYRALGLVIMAGLALHFGFTYGVIILLGETAGFALTLAGIAGLIVSVGIAADSFIVYFERIKDEVLQGRGVRTAVDRAWTSARRTIVAADLVTALAATVLYLLAVGGVRGFALMLGLSTALDLFVSFLFMHPLVWNLAQTRLLARARSLGVGAGAGAPAVSGGAE